MNNEWSVSFGFSQIDWGRKWQSQKNQKWNCWTTSKKISKYFRLTPGIRTNWQKRDSCEGNAVQDSMETRKGGQNSGSQTFKSSKLTTKNRGS